MSSRRRDPTEPPSEQRSRRNAFGALIIALLLGILTAIDLERFLATGWIQVGRENQILSGLAAQLVIGAFALGALGCLVFGIASLLSLRRGARTPRNDGDVS